MGFALTGNLSSREKKENPNLMVLKCLQKITELLPSSTDFVTIDF